MGRTITVGLAIAVFAASPARAGSQAMMASPDAKLETVMNRPVATVSLVEGTSVEFEFVEGISSKTAKVGQHFAIRLVAPILAGNTTVVPAGAKGEGEVIHAARAGAAGKAGELILSARFIEFDGQRVPLRGFRFSQSGVSRIDQAGAMNAAIAGASVFVPLPPVALLIGGKNIDVAPLTRGTAKIATGVAWPLPNIDQR